MRVIPPKDVKASFVSNVPETEHPVWSASAIFAKDAKAIHEHRIYTSQIDGNTGKVPPENLKTPDAGGVAPWLEVGPTNKYAMLDGLISTPTIHDGDIEVTVDAGKCDCLCLFGLAATEVVVVRKSGDNTVLLDETIPLIRNLATSWLEYFFEEPQWRSKLLVQLPLSYTGTVAVTIRNSNGKATCSQLVVGLAKQIGNAKYNASTGILDFSRKRASSDGEQELVPRGFADRLTVDVDVPSVNYDAVRQSLTALRGKAAVYQCEETGYEAHLVFGYFIRFEQLIPGQDECTCSLEVEGLTVDNNTEVAA